MGACVKINEGWYYSTKSGGIGRVRLKVLWISDSRPRSAAASDARMGETLPAVIPAFHRSLFHRFLFGDRVGLSEKLDRCRLPRGSRLAAQTLAQIVKPQVPQHTRRAQVAGLPDGGFRGGGMQAARQITQVLPKKINVLHVLLPRPGRRGRWASVKDVMPRMFDPRQDRPALQKLGCNAVQQRSRLQGFRIAGTHHSLPTTRSIAVFKVTVVNGFLTRLLTPNS